MNVNNILKLLTVASITAVARGTAQPMIDQSTHTQAVVIPKFAGEIDQTGFICDQKKYLEWQEEFHRGGTGYIDGVRPEHLNVAVKCGIDRWNRPFIAFKYTCTRIVNGLSKVTKGAATIFQRYNNSPSPIVSAGHFKPKGCSNLGPLNPLTSPTFVESFTGFLKGAPIKTTSWEENSIVELRICDDVLCPPDKFELPSSDTEL